jgi:hypothetical protein
VSVRHKVAPGLPKVAGGERAVVVGSTKVNIGFLAMAYFPRFPA